MLYSTRGQRSLSFFCVTRGSSDKNEHGFRSLVSSTRWCLFVCYDTNDNNTPRLLILRVLKAQTQPEQFTASGLACCFVWVVESDVICGGGVKIGSRSVSAWFGVNVILEWRSIHLVFVEVVQLFFGSCRDI